MATTDQYFIIMISERPGSKRGNESNNRQASPQQQQREGGQRSAPLQTGLDERNARDKDPERKNQQTADTFRLIITQK